jgi:hypothetical protein
MFLKMNKKLVLLTVLIILSVAAVLIYLNWDRVYSAPTTATSTVPSTTPSAPSLPPSPVIPVTPIAPKVDVTKYIILFFAVFILLGMISLFLLIGTTLRDRINKQGEPRSENLGEKYRQEIENLLNVNDDDAFVLNELKKKKKSHFEFDEAYRKQKEKVQGLVWKDINNIRYNSDMKVKDKIARLEEMKKNGPITRHFSEQIQKVIANLNLSIGERLKRSNQDGFDYLAARSDFIHLLKNTDDLDLRRKLYFASEQLLAKKDRTPMLTDVVYKSRG